MRAPWRTCVCGSPRRGAGRAQLFPSAQAPQSLPIVNARPSPRGTPPTPGLDLYYRNCVVGGIGAFMVVARDLDDFAGAVLRKLILEIAGAMPSPRLIPAAVGTALPCDVGEGLSLDYMDY